MTKSGSPSLLGRLLLAVAVGLVTLVIGWRVLRPGDDGGTVRLVDDQDEVEALIEQRRTDAPVGAPPTDTDGPHSVAIRETVSEEDANTLFPPLSRGSRHAYDPLTYFHRDPHERWKVDFPEHPDGSWWVRTNSLGLREDGEIADEAPDLRVLVVGDSHSEGVCNNSESYANLLEAHLGRELADLSVEVVNASNGYFTFWNYLGVLEKFLDLEPDVFVMTVYGGNDYKESLRLRHFFERTDPPRPDRPFWDRIDAFHDASRTPVRHMGQAVMQLAYLSEMPGEEALAAEIARDVTHEVARLCRERGVHLVGVYLPSLWATQLDRFEPEPDRLHEALGLDPDDRPDDRLADAWLAQLEELGAKSLDLRPTFRAHPQRLFWESDHHISVEGQRVVAEALLPVVLGLAAE